MKKLILCLAICCLGLFVLSFFTTAKADDVVEESKDAGTLASELFTKYYNEGSYKKDTVININEKVSSELEEYFHANVSLLERTTYYKNDELWMSNGRGYSGYGTQDGKLTNFFVSTTREKGAETVLSIEGGMEGYYCTLNDFVEGKHNSAHVEKEVNLNDGWLQTGNVLYSKSQDVIEGYRLFTAPLWLNNEASRNYVTFALVTLEEEVLVPTGVEENSVNDTRLVMKLWASSIDNAKVASDETFALGEGESYYLFSKAYIYRNYIENLVGNGTENDPYLIQNNEDWITFGKNAETDYLYDGEYVKLTADINVNETVFKDTYHKFRGTLDGNDKTINASIVGSSRLAVIGYTGKKASNNSVPTVKNLTVSGSVEGADKTGALVAVHYGAMENCTNEASVTGANEVGGLVGYLCIGGKIENSTNNGAVTGTSRVGGISGYTGGNSIVRNCKNYAKVEGDYTIGGIVGIASQTLEISYNVNEGAVVGILVQAGNGIGGIVGSTEKDVKINNCENKGAVTFNAGGYNAGGIVGYVGDNKENPTVINECTNSANVTAARYVGGIVGNNLGGVILNSSNAGEINGTTPTSGNEFYLGGIVGRSATNLTVTQKFFVRIYKSMTEFTTKEMELEGTIVNCSNSGKVYANAEITTQLKIGGIVGYLNQDGKTGILTACYNSGEVIGTSQTGGLIGLAQSTTPKQSGKYCYQLGKTVHNLSGTFAASRYSSQDNNVCIYIGKTSITSAAQACVYLISSSSTQPNSTQLEEGYCAYYTK